MEAPALQLLGRGVTLPCGFGDGFTRCPIASNLPEGDDVMTNSNEVRRRADASFKRKDLQVRERVTALADYEATLRAVEKNTARLKALRLARDEQGEQAAAAKKSDSPR
jgi:hypothetical protein